MRPDPTASIYIPPRRSLTATPVRRQRRIDVPRLAILGVVLAGALACGCGTSAAADGRAGASVESAPAGKSLKPRTPTRAESAAAEGAIAGFRTEIDGASAAFVSAVDRLHSDIDRGAVPEARTDELAAQADYDGFRLLESGDQTTASTLDELASDVGAHQTFGGLHAVERDLWTSGDAAQDVTGLVAQAPVAQYLLAKEVLDPEGIGAIAVEELGWVDDMAVPGREELYSRHDAVDIAATVGAAHGAFFSIEPLGHLVAPSLTTSVDRLFARLLGTVSALGDPDQLQDQDMSAATRLSLSQEVDATAAVLSRLAAELAPFGTAGPPS